MIARKPLTRWILGSSPRMTVERFSSSKIHNGPSADLRTFNRIACFADLAKRDPTPPLPSGKSVRDVSEQMSGMCPVFTLDPRIHLSTGLRVPGRDNANVAALATGRQPLNHPASR